MATRAITFAFADGFASDLASELHNLTTDTLSMRLTSTDVPVTTATNAALTEVVGVNYTAGGIICSQTILNASGVLTAQSAVNFLFADDVAGFTDAFTAVIYNDTSSRIIAVSDIRDGVTLVSNAGQDVDINLDNGTDLFTIGS